MRLWENADDCRKIEALLHMWVFAKVSNNLRNARYPPRTSASRSRKNAVMESVAEADEQMLDAADAEADSFGASENNARAVDHESIEHHNANARAGTVIDARSKKTIVEHHPTLLPAQPAEDVNDDDWDTMSEGEVTSSAMNDERPNIKPYEEFARTALESPPGLSFGAPSKKRADAPHNGGRSRHTTAESASDDV
ncbi:hypothetical protein BU23DRAFT_229451 [Bimuria novae-zelandiae CBS 107.79]|uniref:Uncharacterized protein n=1 Tax=Bimuria novae-zelandiae CBS 107.79 TaxID=1447943 RepID=A0A6A5VMZ6_9PLEO|nr:hypothetical protein BU23DRAFT_229451 [Bimuria novae-zelandiae CBS 107.79]